jgi:hypothetical protein
LACEVFIQLNYVFSKTYAVTSRNSGTAAAACHNEARETPITGTVIAMWALRRGVYEEVAMRMLLGIILGALLTVGAAYLYDSHNAVAAGSAPASAQRPLVNWDVAAVKWGHLSERISTKARDEWNRIASK